MLVAVNSPFLSLNYVCFLLQYDSVNDKYTGIFTVNAATIFLDIACPADKADDSKD